MRLDVMLWNKRKPSDPSRIIANAPNQSGYRVAEPDRALTTAGTLLRIYGRFAFDAAESAAAVRERCEEWAHRLLLGESRRNGDPQGDGEPAPVARDFRGVERFFEELRKRESEFVGKNLTGLRRAVLALAKSLSGSIGEDREADAQVEERLNDLSRALDQGDVKLITRSATSLIEASRAFITQRREREARHARKLDLELRELRERLAEDYDQTGSDELTGLFGRAHYERHLEQLTALGVLLAEPPWLLVIEVAAGKPGAVRHDRPAPDATLRQVSHAISRTFLRRQDFAARSGPSELAVLVVDMSRSEVEAATARLLSAVASAARSLSRQEQPCVSIGVVRFRPNEEPDRWRARAQAAVERAREDGGDLYVVGPG